MILPISNNTLIKETQYSIKSYSYYEIIFLYRSNIYDHHCDFCYLNTKKYSNFVKKINPRNSVWSNKYLRGIKGMLNQNFALNLKAFRSGCDKNKSTSQDFLTWHNCKTNHQCTCTLTVTITLSFTWDFLDKAAIRSRLTNSFPIHNDKLKFDDENYRRWQNGKAGEPVFFSATLLNSAHINGNI